MAPKRRFWSRKMKTDSDTADYPVRVFPEGQNIHKIRLGLDPRLGQDPEDFDPDMFDHLAHIGQDSGTIKRQETAYDASSPDIARGELDRHKTETLWATRKGLSVGRQGVAPKSHSFLCPRCGNQVDDSKGIEVSIDDFPYAQKVCRTQCQNWNTENSPHGARRRSL